MSCSIENTAALIPAAGNSGRMGIPKAFIKLPDGRTFLDQITDVYFELGISQVTIVVNPTVFKVLEYRKPIYFDDVKWVVNPQPELGRLLSISMGLQSIGEKEYCFIQNIDQPFATADLLEKMMRFADQGTYVTPAFQGRGGHPLLIHYDITSFLCAEYKCYESLRDALNKFEKYCLETDVPNIWENINTPEDYKRTFGVAMKD